MDSLVGFSKSTMVGGREGTKDRELEWERGDDQMGGGSCLRTDKVSIYQNQEGEIHGRRGEKTRRSKKLL